MGRKGFMPGCSLPSYSPIGVQKTLEYLKSVYPDMSAIQKCCGKPTIIIGHEELFQERYDNLLSDIKACEVDEMIVACQNCYKIMNKSSEFKTISLWHLFTEIGLPKEMVGKAKGSDIVFSIHDSCSTRECSEIHDGIRWILKELGYKVSEPKNTRETTRCCGFGGMIGAVNPELTKKVIDRRVGDFETEYVVTYCAACRQAMTMGGAKSWHIIDLIFGSVVTSSSMPPENVLASPVKAWANRYKSKNIINKTLK